MYDVDINHFTSIPTHSRSVRKFKLVVPEFLSALDCDKYAKEGTQLIEGTKHPFFMEEEAVVCMRMVRVMVVVMVMVMSGDGDGGGDGNGGGGDGRVNSAYPYICISQSSRLRSRTVPLLLKHCKRGGLLTAGLTK